jgi:hypothetical protein
MKNEERIRVFYDETHGHAIERRGNVESGYDFIDLVKAVADMPNDYIYSPTFTGLEDTKVESLESVFRLKREIAERK